MHKEILFAKYDSRYIYIFLKDVIKGLINNEEQFLLSNKDVLDKMIEIYDSF
jgi:hypothetical protein